MKAFGGKDRGMPISKSWSTECPEGQPLAPGSWLAKLEVGATCRHFLQDECVFSQGDQAAAVYYIKTGKVKLTVVSEGGKEAVVAILGENSFFGEACLAGQQKRMSSACCMEPSTMLRMEQSVMTSMLDKDRELAGRLLAHLLSRNIRMESDLVDHLFNSSEKRLARLLLLMANIGQESKSMPLLAKISQGTLAEMIGTTRPRINFFLNRFRQLGFIEYSASGMLINSSLVNVVLHDQSVAGSPSGRRTTRGPGIVAA